MLILLVNIYIKAEHLDAFKTATIENASNSLKEAGVARFDLLQDTDNPTHFQLIEVYRDRDAIAAHKQTAHYDAWVRKVDHMFAEPRTRALFQNVFPGDQNW
jgi:quinol monooxygenase YgiN